MAWKRILVYSGMKLCLSTEEPELTAPPRMGWEWGRKEVDAKWRTAGGLKGIDRVCYELGEEQMGCDCQPIG